MDLPTQHNIYHDPKIDYSIDDPNLPFADYIEKNKQLITQFHPDQHIIDANTPYELPPIHASTKIKQGALLIHGLFDTPFIMKDIGLHLQSQGLLVRSILLPGHSTIPGALLNIQYEQWVQTVKYGITSLLKEVEQIFLVGYSTGATLSLYHLFKQSTGIAGIIMLSPAFQIGSPFAFLSGYAATLPSQRLKWLRMTQEIDYTKYQSVPFNAVYQVYRLTQAIKNLNHTQQPACPIFMGLSYEDQVVSAQAAIRYFHFCSNPLNHMMLYARDFHEFHDPRIHVVSSVYPEWNILDFSHISIPIAPNNFHYGKKGDYPLASHVEEDKPYEYGATTRLHQFFNQALYQVKLNEKKLQRLTFNPDFDHLLQGIDRFIISI